MKDDHRSQNRARWGLLMTHRTPDGRSRMQPVRDRTTGEPIAFATEAEALAVAKRLASIPDTEVRAAPLRSRIAVENEKKGR